MCAKIRLNMRFIDRYRLMLKSLRFGQKKLFFLLLCGALFAAGGIMSGSHVLFEHNQNIPSHLMTNAEGCLVFVEDFEIQKCLNGLLIETSEQYGIKAALQIIEPLSEKHPNLLQWSHPFTHSIGGYGLRFYESNDLPVEARIGRALVECDGFGAFGCYHGVIESGLSFLPVSARVSVIRKACMEDAHIQSKQYYINQCLHWFGHGVAIFANLPLKEALAMCDGLSPHFLSDEVQLCLSGVFHAGSVPGESDDELIHNIANVWKDGDPYYPCLEIEEKFRGHCYSHASGRARTRDLAVGFAVCDNIPEKDSVKKFDYVWRCYDSEANDLLATVLTEGNGFGDELAQKIVERCRRYAAEEYRRFCYAGAARYWVLRDPSPQNYSPFQICKHAEKDAKPSCYGNIGFGHRENYYSAESLASYCRMSELGYAEICRSASVLAQSS